MNSHIKIFFRIQALILLLLNASISTAQTNESDLIKMIDKKELKVREVSDGILWKYGQFDSLFNSTQSITILEIDLKNVRLQVPYVKKGFFKTSDTAEESEAVTAINGSFFDTEKGGGTVFLKVNDKLIHPTREGFQPYRENSGFVFNDNKVDLMKKPEDGWESLKNYHTVLVSGPMLIANDQILDQAPEPFNTNRHPRTAVGLTDNNKLIAVVVDGRNTKAHGMSIPELSQIMHFLGCNKAMNLDGGGSSTLWIKEFGVVSFPSDNKLFDHDGEREVANAILFLKN